MRSMRLAYDVGRGGSLSHWLCSDIGRKDVEAPSESFYAPINMGEAYVQIVYPVRRHFLEGHHLERIGRYSGPYSSIYFPFEDTKVNFSTAIKTPTYIWAGLRSTIEVPADGEYPFRISTCGGFRLWVDGEEAETFAPYDRNIPHSKDFTLKLTKGSHTFDAYMDELAERDVFFYIEFLYMGDDPIVQSIDADGDAGRIKRAESFLMGLSMTCTTYCFGGIHAEFDSSMLEDEETLVVEDVGPHALSFSVHNGMEELKLAEGFDEPRMAKASFSIAVGGVRIERRILFNTAPRHVMEIPRHDSLEERKEEALRFASEHGDGLVHQAMAIMRIKGSIDARARECIERSLLQIERKEDCADFVLAPLLWSMMRNAELYPADLYQRAKDAVLSFRYWIDEKGNDAMWYFSENHAFLFHSSQYLAGILFPYETFSVSGRKGSEQRAIGKSRLFTWFRNFSLYRYAEWNSATYFPVDLIGLFSLYEAAEDEDIRAKAEEALDYTFRIIRDNTFHGIMTSSFGRAYENTVKAKELNEPSFLSYIAFNEGHATAGNRASCLFSLSSYAPKIRREEIKEGEIAITTEVQGMEPVWTYSAMTSDYALSCAEAFKPFRHGHQQHVMDCTLGREASFFINHPGERAYSGENRPAYWAGNGTVPLTIQYRGLLMMIFSSSPDEAVDYIHAYFPTWAFDEWSIEGRFLTARSGNGYLGAYFSSTPVMTEWGMNRKREIIADGRKVLAVVRCSTKAESGSYEDFRKRFMEMEISYDLEADSASAKDFSYGLLEIGRDKEPLLNSKPYDWRVSEGYSRTIEAE